MDPINYSQAVAAPVNTVLQGYQGGLAVQQAQQAQQQQQQQIAAQQQMQQDLSAFYAKPDKTGTDYANITARYPQLAEPLKKSFDMMSTAQRQSQLNMMTPVYAALHTGNTEIAAGLVEKRADALEASGDQVAAQAARTQAEIIRAHPEFARAQIGLGLAAIDPDHFSEAWDKLDSNQRADQKLPGEVRKVNADADKAETDATYAGPTARAGIANINSQIWERGARLGLDQDRLNSEMGVKVAELRRKPGYVDLPESAVKIVNDSAQNSVLASNVSRQMTDLAGQIEKADPRAFAGGLREGFKSLTGSQDYVTSLRQEYLRVRSSEVTKMLPPGPASDKDIALAMAGFPSETADPAAITGFLRGMAKLKDYESKLEDAKSQWVGETGSLGRAGNDMQIGDIKVPRGMTFQDFARKTMQAPGAQTIDPSDPVAALTAKYGQPMIGRGAPR